MHCVPSVRALLVLDISDSALGNAQLVLTVMSEQYLN